MKSYVTKEKLKFLTEKYGTGCLIKFRDRVEPSWYAPACGSRWIILSSDIEVLDRLSWEDGYETDSGWTFCDVYGNELQHPIWYDQKYIEKETYKVPKQLKARVLSGQIDVKDVVTRRTGRTLGLAYHYIGFAMTNPEQRVKVVDHHGTRNADKDLLRVISRIIDENGLEYFELDISGNVIKYKPFVTMRKTTVWEEL